MLLLLELPKYNWSRWNEMKIQWLLPPIWNIALAYHPCENVVIDAQLPVSLSAVNEHYCITGIINKRSGQFCWKILTKNRTLNSSRNWKRLIEVHLNSWIEKIRKDEFLLTRFHFILNVYIFAELHFWAT